MWARNLLFLGVLVGGVLAFRASLFPLRSPATSVHFDPGPTKEDDFQHTLSEVDAAFRSEWHKPSEADGKPLDTAWISLGRKHPPYAADLMVARRLSLALTGTVPSLEEVRQLEAAAPETRLSGWTHHLLSDPRFGDYFAERLARVYVGTEDGPFIVYRRRRFVSWLSDELMKNTPYGDLVRQLIATEGLSTDKPAVNFITVAIEGDKKAPNPERMAGRVSRAFLGLRIDCAQCHDHFLEPTWKQQHFQGLAAFFGQTHQGITNISDGDGEYEYEYRHSQQKVIVPPAVPFLPELLPAEGTRRQRLAAWVTHRDNPYFARATVNRIWALMFNKPLLESVESMHLDEKGPAALDILARDFTAHDYDLHRLIQLIAATEVFRLDSAVPCDAQGKELYEITDEHEQAWAVFPMTRLRPEQVIGSILQSASVKTINQQSHILVRLGRSAGQKDFVQRYGDNGDDEFAARGGTIPQRLLLMNGNIVNEKARAEMLNASSQIAMMAPTDRAAIETAYLTVYTRRPNAAELNRFVSRIEGINGNERQQRLADLYWVLFNATEMSWNH